MTPPRHIRALGLVVQGRGVRGAIAALVALGCSRSGFESAAEVLPYDLRAVQIAAGYQHTCIRAADGGVLCWGANGSGQLGDGTTRPRVEPTAVLGLDSGIGLIAAGWEHTCALDANGGVSCWGWSGNYELGDGSNAMRSGAGPVSGLGSDIVDVRSMDHHSCALSRSGTLYCWGSNYNGQIGDGSTTTPTTPVAVIDLPEAIATFAPGDEHTCAVGVSGAVYCWGLGWAGQLGHGASPQFSVSPVTVQGLPEPATSVIGGGQHTCAILRSGAVSCWGENNDCRLGNGTDVASNVATKVLGLSDVVQLTAGWGHTCARSRDGTVRCWGRNLYGQLGVGSQIDGCSPALVGALPEPAVDIDSGWDHTCAALQSGHVWCWGAGFEGALGPQVIGYAYTPTPADQLTGTTVVDVGAGIDHTCIVDSAAAVRCAGSNGDRQFGSYEPPTSFVPVTVPGLEAGVTHLSVGDRHGCAIRQGEPYCWGAPWDGRLGDGEVSDMALTQPIGVGSGVLDISAGGAHSCAVTAGGGAKCWGSNFFGQLGDGTFSNQTLPVDVVGLQSGVAQISCGGSGVHTCAVLDDGRVMCWGAGYAGALGNGSEVDSPLPVEVQGLPEAAVTVTAGEDTACARLVSNRVFCWGRGDYGQLGTGRSGNQLTAVEVMPEPGGFAQVEAGHFHVCVVTTTGRALCFGKNERGRLGIGVRDSDSIAMPTEPLGLPSSIAKVSAGSTHTCALTVSGALWCWGTGGSGQLFTNIGIAMVPVPVGQ